MCNKEGTSPRITQALLHQIKLGRHMIQWGILTKHWRYIMDDHLQSSKKSTPKTLAILCNKIWNITKELWKDRCDEEHNNENSLMNEKRNIKADEEIENIFAELPSLRKLPLADRAFFKKDKVWWKKQRLREKIKWIRRAKIIMM